MRAFETFYTVDPDTLEENWRACSIEEVRAYIHGDPIIKLNAKFGEGRTELEAIAKLCFLLEDVEGTLLTVVVNPKFCVGQRVYIPKRKEWVSGYHGTITYVSGMTGAFSSVMDQGEGLQVRIPYDYTYSIEDTDGTTHREVYENSIEALEDDGA